MKAEIQKFFKNKANLLGLLIAFFGAYLLFSNFFEFDIMPLESSFQAWHSLDPSWVVALSYVKVHDMTWGTEVAFTYGPLAHLGTRVGWGENKFSFLLFDIFLFVN